MKIDKLTLILFLILQTACLTVDKAELFYATTFSKLITTKHIEILNKSNISSNKNITSPPYTWMPLIQFTTNTKNKYCLIYKTPFKTESKTKHGILNLTKLKNGQKKCQETVLKESNVIATLLIQNAKIFFPKSDKTVDGKKLDTNYVYIKLLTLKNKSLWFSYPLLNLKRNRRLKKYDSHVSSTIVPSTIFLLSEGNESEKTLGTINDSYGMKNLNPCHKLNKSCDDILSYQCNKCRFGHYEVITLNCKTKGDKFCGIDNCGKKNMPACLRGNSYRLSKKEMAIDSKRRGYCLPLLRKFWDQNGVLICL